MGLILETQVEIQCDDSPVVLRGDATAYLPEHGALLVADLHLGKDASFRAGGIPVPRGMNLTILRMLSTAIEATEPRQVYLLGDLIHDRRAMTADLIEDLAAWRAEYPEMELTLVRGNHDRQVTEFPENWQMKTTDLHRLDNFELRHEVSAASLAGNGHFQIGGHWHPVVWIGRGADRERFSCFVVGRRQLTLPSFGPFKGGLKQLRTVHSVCYPICEGKVWKQP